MVHAIFRGHPSSVIVVGATCIEIAFEGWKVTRRDIKSDPMPWWEVVAGHHVAELNLIYLAGFHQHGPIEAFAVADAESIVGQINRLAVRIYIDELDHEVCILGRGRDI